MIRSVRYVQLSGAVGTIRTAQFENRDHFVVPVVALVEGVIQGMGAPTPEYVPIEVLEIAPGGWNGRPALTQHPVVDNEPVSANDPRMLEIYALGRVFSSKVEDNKLKMEAWIDPLMVERMGDKENGEDLLRRLQSGEMIEVSVGAFVVAEEVSDEFEGVEYGAVWRSVTPDHLALLPEGVTGACSNEMGCGTPRVAQMNVLTDGGKVKIVPVDEAKERSMKDKKKKEKGSEPRSLRERLSAMLESILRPAQESMSDEELRSRLWEALHAEEPAFEGIEAVFSEENLVIYWVSPEGEWMTFRRSYQKNEEGDISLADDRVQVELEVRYEPVSAAQDEESCQCHTKPETRAAKKGKRKMADSIKKLVAALIANERTPYTEADEAWLSKVPEERLKAMEEHAEAESEEPEGGTPDPEGKKEEPKEPEGKKQEEPEGKAEPVAAETVEVPKEQWEEVSAMAAERKQERAARKEQLIAALKGLDSVKRGYTEAELKELSLEQLEKVAKVASDQLRDDTVIGVDFGGRGVPRSASAGDGEIPTPKSLGDSVRAARQA